MLIYKNKYNYNGSHYCEILGEEICMSEIYNNIHSL